MFLPNKELSASRSVNFTALGKRRVVRTVTASYDAPTEDVKAACREALAQVANNLIDPAPEVYLTNYGVLPSSTPSAAGRSRRTMRPRTWP